jgi:hypothetical protein
MEKNNSRGASHPPFSHDLAHSDFLLFGCITGKLQETEFMETDDIHAEIGEILNGIAGKVLKIIFVEWEKRLESCIDAGSEHVE